MSPRKLRFSVFVIKTYSGTGKRDFNLGLSFCFVRFCSLPRALTSALITNPVQWSSIKPQEALWNKRGSRPVSHGERLHLTKCCCANALKYPIISLYKKQITFFYREIH